MARLKQSGPASLPIYTGPFHIKGKLSCSVHRFDENRPKQRAIIVSGFSESDRVHEAQGLGAGAYVKKPYVKEKLGMAVRKELERKTSR
jgi:DNA-binding NtrC family response regulator